MMDGWIKVHRKMLDWEWYADPNTKAVFLHLLLTANFRDTKYMGVTVHAGETIIGRKALAEAVGISEQNVRTALKRLKSTHEITIQSTNRFSIVTIVNWESYQLCDEEPTSESTRELTINQPATNQQLTTPEERKNVKKEKKDIYSDVPEEIREAFMGWVSMRTKIKKPITSKATVTRALNTLYKLSKRTDVQIQIINQSTDMCWQSFYPLKADNVRPKAYKEFEKEPEYEAEEMPQEIRDKLNGLFTTPL